MKEALPLISTGYTVHLIANKVTQFSEHLKTVSVFQDHDQLVNAIALFKDADIFHCHNEPSWFVTAVKEVWPNKPVVLDMHDSMLLRRSDFEIDQANNPNYYRVSAEERNNVQLADGLVYVCDPMKEIVEREFKPACPSIVLPSYVPERFNRIDFDRWYGGLVYEGRIDIEDELDDKWDFFQYSNYIDLAKKSRELSIPFHVYTPRKNEKVRRTYQPHVVLHEPVGLPQLIKQIGRHDWGLVGNIRAHEEWQHALPNKLFEYMAACLPVVSMNAKLCDSFVTEHGVGISVKSLEELAERWREHRECRKTVIKRRGEFVMEKHIHKLEELYKAIA